MKNRMGALYKNNFMPWGWLSLFILIYIFRALRFVDGPVAPDAVGVYLPFAKNVLERGFDFLSQPKSIIVPPVAYLWPALFGGEVREVTYANLFAGVFMVILVYAIGRQLHSRMAGLIAAFLFAISPFLVRWVPTALSEPPFFLFTLTWLWGVGEVLAGKKWAIPVAAIALSLSILTRSIWLYPSIVILVGTVCWMLFKPAARQIAWRLIAALLLGLMLPILVIIKNMVFFGLPAIDSGSGGALFYGTNLMTNGFEPPLLGLAYENGSNDFHSILGNREHASVALQFLKERSVLELGGWYLTKVSWVTFFTVLEAPILASVWRVLEITTALTGVWWGFKTRNAFILLLGVGVGLQILQTSFVLYNLRYSTDNLELLLIPLSAVGVALALNVKKQVADKGGDSNTRKNFFFINRYAYSSIAIASILCVILYFRTIPVISLPPHIPVSILFETENNEVIERQTKSDENKTASAYYVELNVPKQVLPSNVGNALWKIKMIIAPVTGQACKQSSVSFKSLQTSPHKGEEIKFNVYDDGVSHTYLLGTANRNAQLFPSEPGKLVLKVDCSTGRKITVEQIAFIAPHFIETYFHKE